jgi:maltodextrin utilization protein YvdJ
MEMTSGKEKYIRLQADFDNYRKRAEKERHTIRSDAQGDVIESLLPMVDNFERAKQQLKPETEKEKNIDASYQGIYKQFVEIMRSLRVAAVATVGKPFDPSVSGKLLIHVPVVFSVSIYIVFFLACLFMLVNHSKYVRIRDFDVHFCYTSRNRRCKSCMGPSQK